MGPVMEEIMSNFSDYVFRQLGLRASINTISNPGSLLTKVDNNNSRNYVPLPQGTVGQILTSHGENNVPVWQDNIPFEINSLEADTIVSDDVIAFYDISESDTNKITFANLEGILSHDNLASKTIASHDTSATGAQLTTLTDDSVADILHRHSALAASDGDPDTALSITVDGECDLWHNDIINIGEIVNTLFITLEGSGGADSAAFGPNLVTNGTFDSDLTGWTIGDGGAEWVWDTGKARHVVLNDSTFYQGINVVDGERYQAEFTISGNTGGYLQLKFGTYPCTVYQSSNKTHYITFVAYLTGSIDLVFTPQDTFNGKIDDVKLQQLTGTSTPVLVLRDTTGSTVLEVRGENTVRNVYIGLNVGQYNTEGYDNAAVGVNSLSDNTTGFDNIAFGAYSLYSNTVGYNNVALGGYALHASTCAYGNIAVGGHALYSTTFGSQNTAIGGWALYSNTTGTYNTGIGTHALRLNIDGGNNTAIGRTAGYSNTTGDYNTCIGSEALKNNATGNYNTAIGGWALFVNTGGNYNTAIGYDALRATTGGQNIGIGQAAAYYNTVGTYNIAIGRKALFTGTTSNYNVALGYLAGGDITTAANYNTFIGSNTGLGIATGDNNTIIGARISGLAADLQNHVIIADGAGNKRIIVDASGNHKYGDGGTTNYTQISATGDQTFHGSAGFYPRTLEQDTKPAAGTGATQIDSGEMLIWIDTNDSNKVYTVYNYGGTVVAALLAL